jgi:hypothetical protein
MVQDDKAWTDLDRIRAMVARLEQRCSDGKATIEEMEELKLAIEKCRFLEEEAMRKWKQCFGS